MTTEWFTDANGNRASVAYWGSEKAAEASLKTLRDCSYCSDCSDCSRCSNCSYCSRCSDCNLSLPHVRLPVSDNRGYAWLATAENGGWRIRVGCRNFSPAEAREHWLAGTYGGSKSIPETLPFALEWLAKQPMEVRK